jgi:hypothetical protein
MGRNYHEQPDFRQDARRRIRAGGPNSHGAGPVGDIVVTPVAGTSLRVGYTPACGATSHAIYWATGPIVSAPICTHVACGLGSSGVTVFDPGNPPAGSLYDFVIVEQNASSEGSYGLDRTLRCNRTRMRGSS